MSKLTPRPWQYWDRGNIGPVGEKEIWIGVDHPEYGGCSLATVRAGCDESAELGSVEATAAHIVKCVNMHEKLLASLKELCHELDINYMDDHDSYAGHTVRAVNKMLRKAQALLAKAEQP